jgi:hypothetical protein
LFALSACATTADQQAYYQAVKDVVANQKPLLAITAQPGQNVVISGLASMVVYAPNDKLPAQFVDPAVGVARDVIVGLTGLGSVYLGLYGAEQIVKATGAIAGHNVNYGSGSLQGTNGIAGSPNSGFSQVGRDANSGQVGASPSTVTTTTTETTTVLGSEPE